MQLLNIKYTFAFYTSLVIFTDYIKPLIGPIHPAVYYILFAHQLLAVTIITIIGYGKELSNLAKIYNNNIKYSVWNDNIIFKLAIFDYI